MLFRSGCTRDSGPVCRSPSCARDSGLVYRRAARGIRARPVARRAARGIRASSIAGLHAGLGHVISGLPEIKQEATRGLDSEECHGQEAGVELIIKQVLAMFCQGSYGVGSAFGAVPTYTGERGKGMRGSREEWSGATPCGMASTRRTDVADGVDTHCHAPA